LELTKTKKATAQESISIQAIRDVILPLPPLAEQQRIVAAIEVAFEQLDSIAATLA
jgi:type I restriction enzyme S subunit